MGWRIKIVSTIVVVIFFLLLFPSNAQDIQVPTLPCDFMGYEARALGLKVGDIVSLKDADGNKLAERTVSSDGQFGFLTIENASEGETVYFYINGVEQASTGTWTAGKVERVDLGIPKTPLNIEITSPQESSAVSTNPITISGQINNPEAHVEITINTTTSFTPQVQPDGRFSISDVDLEGGPNNIVAFAQDSARNTATCQTYAYLGWVLHLKAIPWYEKEKGFYSGAATCKMILDYLREEDETTGKTQDELYTYGHAYSLSENTSLLEMDAKAVDAVLGHFDPYDTPGNWYDKMYGAGDPYIGYNFDIEVFDPTGNPDALTHYMRDIIHWVAWPVTVGHWWQGGELVARPNAPAAVPIYGSYNNWVVINGAVASENPMPDPMRPWYTPLVTVYGFWITDAAQGGLGKDVYLTASEAGSTYFLPLVTTDRYNGKYLQVAEPPENESEAKVYIAPESSNDSTLKLIKVAQDLEGLTGLRSHIYDSIKVIDLYQDLAMLSIDAELSYLFEDISPSRSSGQAILWYEIIDPQALTDADFRKAVECSIAREFIKVEREDEGDCYYVIPFDKYVKGQFLTYAAIIIDGATGSFKEATWVTEPVRFVPIDKAKAEKLVIDYSGSNPQYITSQLIWEVGGLSSSPFFPYWEVEIEGNTYYVTQDGKVRRD